MLEVPQSSFEARCLQLVLILLICISIFSLYTQTIVNLSDYGESTPICKQVVRLYCADKNDYKLDPGCYVQQLPTNTSTSSSGSSSQQKLDFDCSSDSCYGHGFNFGSNHALVTCRGSDHTQDPKDLGLDDDTVVINKKPFQDAAQLKQEYGPPYLFTSRQKMHRISPVCRRIECIDNTEQYLNVKELWRVSEFVISLIFSVEILLRIVVSENWRGYIFDLSNLFDIVSVVPFYVDVLNLAAGSSIASLDFSILASSPEPIILVVIRSLKVGEMILLLSVETLLLLLC